MTTPKPPAFDAATFQSALDENIRRKDGKPYAVFSQFRAWKLWVDGLRNPVEAQRIQLADHKKHLDRLDAREQAHHSAQAQRLAAIEAQLANSPFPA